MLLVSGVDRLVNWTYNAGAGNAKRHDFCRFNLIDYHKPTDLE
jgi:hypothetical protein